MTALRLTWFTASLFFRQFLLGFQPLATFECSIPYPVEPRNYLYYLSISTHRKEEPFVSAGVVEVVLDEFRKTAAEKNLRIRAWCFLPGRLDLMVQTSAGDFHLRGFAQLAKIRAARRFTQEFGRPLWLGAQPDRITKVDEVSEEVEIRKMLERPVEMELVEHFMDYPFLETDSMAHRSQPRTGSGPVSSKTETKTENNNPEVIP